MAAYLFYVTADAAQDQMWWDTVSTWGEAQAETYIIGLHRHLERISRQKSLWRRLPSSLSAPKDLTIDVWFSRYKHHYIIFRQLSGGRIGVISILHERMDLPVRLAEDLLRISPQDTNES
ncbi:type II toxin-antitoxin system RelE/ParE family toxin [Agrobacterium sp. Ap1]|uniref:type II toxin-antitoxin system RelE/ParE family toxin n=1 Tax=Agrobacterium sp. Ap1 TaxID=2815337 RepID=UPI001A8C2B5C|nr:type II toxin-antitoxin system RelE/ParE family toxin [Agrobacterium sp. Ap1]MBO0142859.1 type II toxin-antitoxin system RelE/ParE family toxin [Agrobacterium sp. Ap1]